MFGNNGLQGLVSVKLARSFCVPMGSLQLFQLPPTAQTKNTKTKHKTKAFFWWVGDLATLN